MYGQQSGASPIVPFAAGSPKPGPTGPGIAIASACVAVAAVVAGWILRFLWSEVSANSWVIGLSAVAVDVIPVLYLFVAGRGVVGKFLGGGLMFAAMLVDLAETVFWQFVHTAPAWSEMVSAVIWLVAVLLVVAGWGLARRSGALWAISIPVAVGTWSLWYFAISELPVFRHSYPESLYSFGYRYLRGMCLMLLVYVIPIVTGWALELATRGSDGGAGPDSSTHRPAQQYDPRANYQSAPMYPGPPPRPPSEPYRPHPQYRGGRPPGT